MVVSLRLFGIICWALTFYFAPMVFGLPIVIADISLGPYLPSDKRNEAGAVGSGYCWNMLEWGIFKEGGV